MSMQYEVQEHIRIDMNKSGMAGLDMIRALERQLAALEALMQDDEAEIYRALQGGRRDFFHRVILRWT